MMSIFKAEKGAGALKKLSDGGGSSGKVQVVSKVKAGGAKKSAKKAPGVAVASKLIKKTPNNTKKSVGRLKTGKTPGNMKTPTGSGSAAQTPKPTKDGFKRMIKYLKDKNKKP